jgi:hypothetical protein
MTVLSFLAIALGLAGVFGAFWWLVEWTGGLAGSALSVCRSVSSGLDSWRVERVDSAPAAADSSAGAPPDPDRALVQDLRWAAPDPAADVTVEVVRVRRHRCRP